MTASIRKYFRLLSSGKYVLFINILDRLFFFTFFLFIAREYSASSFGEVVTLFTLSTVFVTLFDLGLPLYLQRHLAGSRFGGSEIFSKLFLFNFLIFVGYFALVFLFYRILYPQISFLLLLVISITMFESSLSNLCSKALSGVGDFRSQFVTLLISRVYIISLTVLGIFYFGFEIVSLVSIMLAGFFLHLIILIYILDKRGIELSLNYFSLRSSAPIVKLSMPLGLAVIFNFLYDKIDVLIISAYLEYSRTAVYNVAYGLYKTSSLAFSFILVTGFTRVSFLGRSRKAVSIFFQKYLRLILLICVPLSIAVFLLSSFLIELLYSGKFSGSIAILRILSLAIIAMGCNNLTGIVLNGIGLFKVVMYITLFGLIINVILNLVFIPMFDINAAAWATVITEYFILALELYYLLKIINFGNLRLAHPSRGTGSDDFSGDPRSEVSNLKS